MLFCACQLLLQVQCWQCWPLIIRPRAFACSSANPVQEQATSHCVTCAVQKELSSSKANSGYDTSSSIPQSPLLSLQSGSQQNAEPWDAFSNHTDAAPEPGVQRPPAYAQASPLSPQRQAAAARAKAFIKTQTSNVQSMQVTQEV